MLRPLRIVRLGCNTVEDRQALEELEKALLSLDVPESIHRQLVSVARRYQQRGLSLVELAAAGAGGWQRAQHYYGEAIDKFERWGWRWVQESILISLHENEIKASTQP